jgi:hypothetical protein
MKLKNFTASILFLSLVLTISLPSLADQPASPTPSFKTVLERKVEGWGFILMVQGSKMGVEKMASVIRAEGEASLRYLKSPSFQKYIAQIPKGTLTEFGKITQDTLKAQIKIQAELLQILKLRMGVHFEELAKVRKIPSDLGFSELDSVYEKYLLQSKQIADTNELLSGIGKLRALEDLNTFADAGAIVGRGIVGIAGLAVTVFFANKAGNLAKAEGYGYADGFVDNLMAGSSFNLVPGYIETNKTVLSALQVLSHDPSLEGSWLSDQANFKSPVEQTAIAHRRAEQQAMGEMMYGPNYRLPPEP